MGAGVAKVKEKKERGGGGGDEKEVGGGGGLLREIIIISKSIQIKVVPLYSQVWSNKILRPCPFLSHSARTQAPTQDTDTRHKFLSILLHLHSFHFPT